MYARNPEPDAIWNDALEWLTCRRLPLRLREIEGDDPRLVREVLETTVVEGTVTYDECGDCFDPGPRVEGFDAGIGSPVDAPDNSPIPRVGVPLSDFPPSERTNESGNES